jgi:hypothetical protein
MQVSNSDANKDIRQGAAVCAMPLTDLASRPQQTVGWLYGPDAVVRLPQTLAVDDLSS